MVYVNIDTRGHSHGEENWQISLYIGAAAIQSAVIYDDHLKIVYMSAWSTYRQDGTIKVRYTLPMEVVMDLSSGYEDVLAQVQIRAFTDLPSGISYYPDNGWSFITPIFARGTPDLTPITLAGSRSDDVLYGAMGDDTLTGGRGNDVLHGERATDNHWIGGADLLDGGKGDDQLYGYRGEDHLNGGNGADTLNGGKGADRLDGGSGDDTLMGGAGDDKLIGGAGHDRLDGGTGADLIDGGAGNDVLTGGKGADIFIFHRPDAGTRHADSVTDFELGVDKIRIGEDLLAGANLYPTFNHEEETLTSLTISHFTEPDWAKLLQGFISGGITSDELQQATAHVSPAHFNSSRMTLSFDDVSAQDLTAAIHDAGSLNALLFDVV